MNSRFRRFCNVQQKMLTVRYSILYLLFEGYSGRNNRVSCVNRSEAKKEQDYEGWAEKGNGLHDLRMHNESREKQNKNSLPLTPARNTVNCRVVGPHHARED